MSLNQTYKKAESFLIPEDTYTGLLYSVIELGKHDSGFKNADGQNIIQEKIALTFELPDVKISDGRPAAITTTVSASLNEKSTLFAILQGLGRSTEQLTDSNLTVGDHLKAVLGKGAFIGVVHNKSTKGTVYGNVKTVTKLPSSVAKTLKAPTNTIVFVDDVENITEEQNTIIPAFLRTRIDARIKDTASADVSDNGDVPF